MSWIDDIFGSSNKTEARKQTPEEKRIIGAQATGSELSLDILKQLQTLFSGQSGGLADLINTQIGTLQGEHGRLTTGGWGRTNDKIQRGVQQATKAASNDLLLRQQQLGGVQDQMFQDITRGRTASRGDLRFIDEASDRALKAGRLDIQRFRDEGLEAIKQTIAPARGLRPTDSPILDRFDDVVAESTNQLGQLTQGIRGQQAQLALQYPLQRRAADLAQGQFQNQLFTGQQAFAQGLSDQALRNRLLLSGALSGAGFDMANFGLNVAGGGAAGTGAALNAIGNIQTGGGVTQSPSLIGAIGSGARAAGGLINGIQAIF